MNYIFIVNGPKLPELYGPPALCEFCERQK